METNKNTNTNTNTETIYITNYDYMDISSMKITITNQTQSKFFDSPDAVRVRQKKQRNKGMQPIKPKYKRKSKRNK